jgi:hypothetical protein
MNNIPERTFFLTFDETKGWIQEEKQRLCSILHCFFFRYVFGFCCTQFPPYDEVS